MLDKRSKRILIVFGLAVLAIIISETVRPKPINWNPSFTAFDKAPLGSYVLFEELELLYKKSNIEKVKEDPYQFLKDSSYASNSAYIFINDYLDFDKQQFNLLKAYAAKGNTVFISARQFGTFIEDSLGIGTRQAYSFLEEDIETEFFNKSITQDSLPKFKKAVYKATFSTIDTLKTKALGYFKTENKNTEELNFITLPYEKGRFMFHTLPEAFSNYYLLHGNQQYASQVLSHVTADHFYWDTYLKSGRKVVDSPMRYIFNQEPLKWAYYVLMLGLLLFIILKGKREQRIIKVIEPLQNTSIEFTKTIGDMYFQHKDFGNINAKKITYFLEVIRSTYYLKTTTLDADFIQKLALKSTNSVEKTQKLVQLINQLKEKTVHTEQDSIALNKQIEDFKI